MSCRRDSGNLRRLRPRGVENMSHIIYLIFKRMFSFSVNMLKFALNENNQINDTKVDMALDI